MGNRTFYDISSYLKEEGIFITSGIIKERKQEVMMSIQKKHLAVKKQ